MSMAGRCCGAASGAGWRPEGGEGIGIGRAAGKLPPLLNSILNICTDIYTKFMEL
jgi:hypothetical protein